MPAAARHMETAPGTLHFSLKREDAEQKRYKRAHVICHARFQDHTVCHRPDVDIPVGGYDYSRKGREQKPLSAGERRFELRPVFLQYDGQAA